MFRKVFPPLSPGVHELCCWEEAPWHLGKEFPVGVCYGTSYQPSELLHTHWDPTVLLQARPAEMHYTCNGPYAIKRGKKVKVLVWNILPLFTPDNAASPPPAVGQPTHMIWTTRSSSQSAATLTSKDQAISTIFTEGKTSPDKLLLNNLFFNYFFIIFWLRWVLLLHRLSLVMAGEGYSL